MPDIFRTFAYSEPECVSYSLMYYLFFRTTNLLLYPLILSFSFSQLLRSIFLITHPIVGIWQNFGYGLWVKWKKTYLYIRKCNNITNNSVTKQSTKKQKSQKCKKKQVQTNTDTLDPYDLSQGDWDEVPNENQTRIN